ncbi:MAG: HAMP domain-containing sensor histidine kinase, partial [Patescibacteria group bacterium]
ILTLILAYYLSDRTLQPIKTAYLKQKKFVADSAHEFRTPLTIMKTGSEMILNSDASNDEYKKLIHEQIGEIDYLTEMINELLFLAKNDDVKSISFEEFNLSDLINKQIESISPYAKSKNIKLEDSIQEKIYFNGNNIYLKKLVNNLLKNAIDYNKSNGQVYISLERIKQNIIIRIKDTGIGINKENLKYIFDRFYKIDKSRVRESNGCGLGLSIVQEIVKIHNGKISVTSNENIGSEFTVSFSSYNPHN